jgi:Coenzyme PQQ synthesis protein D (PqqD)
VTSSGHFVPASGVVAEVISGEAVIINLSTGVYYSMDRTGALVWEALAAGRSAGEVAASLATSGGVPIEVVEADMDKLLTRLVAEGLVAGSADVNAESTPLSFPAGEYVAPTLTSYRDMRDLLALDPPAPGLDNIAWNSSSTGPKT